MTEVEGESQFPGVPLSRHPRPRTEDEIRLAFVSDIHLTRSREGTWKVLHRTEERYRLALEDINQRDVKFVQFMGDLTHGGSPEHFAAFDRIRESLQCPSTVIPGNHDVPKESRAGDRYSFEEFTDRFQISEFPTSETVDDITLVGLNTAYAEDGSLDDHWGGRVGDAQIDRLESLLESSTNPIVCLHHNLGPLPEHPSESPWTWFPAEDGDRLVEILANRSVPLAISGHHHVPTTVQRGDVTELICPSVCSFPQSYLLLTIGPNGTTVSLIPLAGREGIEEAYWAAKRGDTVGRGVLEIAVARLAALGPE
jgi:3',5'-cyclic AMP phosphodiesterase CpdA